MKTGFNLLLWTTHCTDAHRRLLDRVKATGYDGVEIPIFEGTPEHFAALGVAVTEAGLGVTGVGVVPDADTSPISQDPAARARGAEHLAWLVDCAAALGAEVLAGPFHQPLGVFTGTGATAEERARGVAAHQEMADRAAAHGLTLAIEPLNRFECYFLNTAADSAAYVAEVGRPNFGYLYDTFHANIEERDPIGAIAATAPAIAHVHISENDRGAPGSGHIDIAGTIAALRRAGYDGWLTVEAFGSALPDLAAATRVWRPLFETEDDVLAGGIAAMRRGLAS